MAREFETGIEVYMGGEKDPEKIIIPKRFDRFFNKWYLFGTLIVLTIMLLIAGLQV